MPRPLDVVVGLAPEFMAATGLDRAAANRVLCTFAGVATLYDLDRLGAARTACYMRSVIAAGGGGENGEDSCRSTE